MTQSTTPPSAHELFEHALTLLVRQHGGTPEQSAQAARSLDEWSEQAPEHASARSAAEAAWQLTEASQLRDALERPQAINRTRRRIATSVGLGVLAVLGARLLWQSRPASGYEHRFETHHGELASHHLPDGTQLDLAPRTRIHVRLNAERRDIILERGTVRFAVAHDPARPFVVAGPWGEVRVLGTVFSVTSSTRGMTVAVSRGRVALRASSATDGPGVTLTRGQQARLDAGGWHHATISPEDVGAWQRGWLVFNDTTLAEAVAQWNDYLAEPIALDDDPRLGPLRLTGSFPLDAPSSFLDSLPDILPVRVARDADRTPRIVAR